MDGNQRKKNSLGLNYIFNFISQIVTLVIPLITTPYLARIFLEEGSGQIAFSNTIITYFTMIANLGYSVYGQREIAKCQDDKYKKSKIFWEIFIIRCVLTLISYGTLLGTMLIHVYPEVYTTLILLFSIQIIAVVFDVSYFYQGEEDFKYIALRNLVMRILCLICIFIFVKTKEDIWKYALLYSVSIFLANISMWPKLRKSLQKIFVRDLSFKKHFLPSLIIFLPTLATTVYASLDKIMIGYLTANPDYENGCYNQALKLNQTILILITVIDSIMIARNSHNYSKGDFNQVKNHIYFGANYVWHLGLPLIVGMCILSSNLSSWYLGAGYDEVYLLLDIMSVRFIVSGMACVFGNQLFIPIGKEKYTTIAHIITCISNLILNFIFIPLYGAIGGAITTALAEAIDFIVLSIFVLKGKYVSIKKIILMMWKPALCALIMGIPIYFINQAMRYSIWSFILSIGVGSIVYGVCLLIVKDRYVFSIIAFLKAKIIRKRNIQNVNSDNEKTD